MKDAEGIKRKHIFFSLVCLAISMTFLLIGLWPLNFWPENHVHRLESGNGLRFDRYGIVYSREPFIAAGSLIDLAHSMTIIIEMQPRDEPDDDIPRIISICDRKGRELVFIGQWRSELIVQRLSEYESFRPTYRETGIDGLYKDAIQTIAIRSENAGLSIYSDGKFVKSIPGFSFSHPQNSRDPAYLLVGNSPSGKSPWRGDLFALSLFPGSLPASEIERLFRLRAMRLHDYVPDNHSMVHYAFSENDGVVFRGGPDTRSDLLAPSPFRAPWKGILTPTWRIEKFNHAFWKDVFVNVFGFIPFGFALTAWIRTDNGKSLRSDTSKVMLLGGGISLVIELLQAFLPARDSSLTDLLANIVGTYAGVFLFRKRRSLLFR